jgi:hypothetical protein
MQPMLPLFVYHPKLQTLRQLRTPQQTFLHSCWNWIKLHALHFANTVLQHSVALFTSTEVAHRRQERNKVFEAQLSYYFGTLMGTQMVWCQLRTVRPRNRSSGSSKVKIFHLSISSRPGALSPRLKRQGLWADHTLSTSAVLSCAFVGQCLLS